TRPADPVKSIASGDEIAVHLVLCAVLAITYLRPGTVHFVDADIFDFEQHLATGSNAGIVEVLKHLSLRVNGDAFPSGEFLKVNAMPLAVEAQFDPIMHKTFALHALADTHLGEEVDGVLFQDPGAHTFFDVMTAAVFQNDRFDAVQMQEMRQHQACGPGAYNSDLCALYRRHDGSFRDGADRSPPT